jgi:hypothetical protein
MDERKQGQKEVGRKYRDNLGYFKKAPFLAREKTYLCMLAVLLGLYGIFLLETTHRDKVYNPAPLSVSHASLEGNCAACHTNAARDRHREWDRCACLEAGGVRWLGFHQSRMRVLPRRDGTASTHGTDAGSLAIPQHAPCRGGIGLLCVPSGASGPDLAAAAGRLGLRRLSQ